MKNWRTTVVGAITGFVLIAKELLALLDSDPTTLFSFEGIVAGLTALGLGYFAKDAGVTGVEK